MTETANYSIPMPELSDVADITKVADAINIIDSVIKTESVARQNAGENLRNFITEKILEVSQSAMQKDGSCTVNFIIPTYFKTYADYDNSRYVVKSDTPAHMTIGDYQADFDINFESGFIQDDTSQQGQTEVRHFYLSKNGIGWSAEAVSPYVDLNTFDFKVALVDVEFTYDVDYGWLPPGDASTGGEEIEGKSSISPLCSLNREKVINAIILNLLTNSQNRSSAGDSTMSSRISNIESKLDKITAPTGSSVVYAENTQA